MKIQRAKKLQKTINFYKNNFGYREPFQILIDATFCHVGIKVRNFFSINFFLELFLINYFLIVFIE